MHVEVHACLLGLIRVVAFWNKYEKSCKLRVAVQCTDTLNNVAIEDLECFATDDKLASNESGAG